MPARLGQLEFALAESADALISPEGDLLVVEFNIGAEEPLRFGLPFAAAKELFAKMSYLTSATIGDKTATGGMGFVRMTEVSSIHVNPVDAPGKIAICLTDTEKIPHYFEISSQASAELRPKLRSAEAAVQRGVRLPRA
nr:hypothetical protein REQ54_04773 [Rhizobium sp. Q54]